MWDKLLQRLRLNILSWLVETEAVGQYLHWIFMVTVFLWIQKCFEITRSETAQVGKKWTKKHFVMETDALFKTEASLKLLQKNTLCVSTSEQWQMEKNETQLQDVGMVQRADFGYILTLFSQENATNYLTLHLLKYPNQLSHLKPPEKKSFNKHWRLFLIWDLLKPIRRTDSTGMKSCCFM